MPHPTLALADVHRITVSRGARELDVFVFDHHRTAFTIWCEAAKRAGPLTLVTLDRHMDLMTPQAPAPRCDSELEVLDAFARHRLAPSNDDHIVAALEAGAIGDAVVVARSHEPPSLQAFSPYRDRTGAAHRFAFAPTLARLQGDAHLLVQEAPGIALDVDLDCFTTRSDAEPDDVLAWDEDAIDRFLRPPASEAFWREVLDRTRVITLAREPYHCGGFARGARLWIDFARVFFERVLGVPPP